MRPYHLLLALGVLLAGCEYPGPGIGGSFDFSAAASLTRVVGVSNHWGTAYRTWDPLYYNGTGRILTGEQLQMDVTGVLYPSICGLVADGMVVVHSNATHRFFYVGTTTATICLASAPDDQPFQIDRRYNFSNNDFLGSFMDQPHLIVTGDKIIISEDDVLNNQPGNMHVMVLSLADVVNNAPPPLARRIVLFSWGSMLAPVIDDDAGNYDAFVLEKGPNAQITITRIRGLPGSGNVRFATDTLGVGGPQDEIAGVVAGGYLWTAALHTNDGAVELHRVGGLMAPDGAGYHANDTGGARTAGGYWMEYRGSNNRRLSLSASPRGHVAVGWTVRGVPYLGLWTFNGCWTGAVPENTDVYSTSSGRRDFMPAGLSFFDARAEVLQWWTGVGWGDATNRWTFSNGLHTLFLRDDQFPVC
jgi:hypothetical protein